LLAALVERPGPSIRRLAGGRARQMQFSRFLHNQAVTVEEMSASAAARTAGRVAGRDVIAIQDSSELFFGGKTARERGFGPIGRGGATRGLLLHAVLAVDAADGGLLGPVHVEVRNRDGEKPAPRRTRATGEKESQRWLTGMLAAAAVLGQGVGQGLGQARRITVVGDRESDIYEEFARRPSNVHLITRVAQNRRIDGDAASLFDLAEGLPEQARHAVTIPAAPGRKAREAVLALRYSPVLVRRPKHGAAADLADAVALTLVDVSEVGAPADGSPPVHWRLLTTHRVAAPGEARMILDFYRRRWIIEDYFRTLKSAGFDIEACALEQPDAMMRFVAAVACAAVTVLQLVRARDGSNQVIADAFDHGDQPLLETLSRRLEGKTERQKNPHPKGTLAFAAWVIARLGSWDGYYGKPGPKVMRIGLQDFQMIKYGHHLEPRNV
jgi:hypothetical protein